MQSVARYGELAVNPNGTSAMVSYPAEEQIYYILEGNGALLYEGPKSPGEKGRFHVPAGGVKHGMANSSNAPVRL